MLKRTLYPRILAMWLAAVGMSACDHLLFVGARAPLTTVPTRQCARQLGRFGSIATEDSVRYVEASLGYLNRRPRRRESDSLASVLAADVRAHHVTCEPAATPAERRLIVISHPAPYIAWSVAGTGERVWLRSLVDSTRWIGHLWTGKGRRMLQVDTLVLDSARSGMSWVTVQRLPIPDIPKGYAIATECARGDSPPTGRVVAVVRNRRGNLQPPILRVWELDVAALRLSEGPTSGVRCVNTPWKWRSP